ncbi:MAG: glycosyltransferase [Proteobacteria bacterium]|nr:MAG: glycosyltransferase [Pseudomonadota bacterium]
MTKMFSIIHVIPSMKEQAAGPSYSVYRLSKSIESQDFNSSIACCDGGVFHGNKNIHSFELGIGPRKLGNAPQLYQWLREQTINGKIDVIHNHSLWMMSNIYPGWIKRQFDVPLVVAPRGTLSQVAFKSGSILKKFIWPLLQKPSVSIANCFHATAESEYLDIRRLGFKQPVAIIPNGVDIPDLPIKVAQKEVKRLLFLGRIHPIKGLDMLLKAWQVVQVKFPDWELKIVGTDNYGYLDTLRKMSKDLNLERIEFAGAVYGDDKWREYYDADLYVLPTYSENFGMSVAEAFAAATPVITTKGAPWSMINEYEAGWWIDVSLDGLVNSLRDALDRPLDELREMGLQGNRMVRDNFDWNAIGEKSRALYSWMIDGGEHPDFIFKR